MANPGAQRESGRGPLGTTGTASSLDNNRVPRNTPGSLGINDAAAVLANGVRLRPDGQLRLNHRTFIKASHSLPDSGKFAIGFGSTRFVALDYSKGLARTTRQFTLEQRFIDYSTSWEKRHSPLAINPDKPLTSNRIVKLGSPFWPIVGEAGTVIGYFGTVHHSRVGTRSVKGTESPSAIIWFAPGERQHSGGDVVSVVVDVDGNILSHQVSDRPLEDSIVGNMLPLLVVGLVQGVVRSAFATLRAGVSSLGRGAGAQLERQAAKRLIAQLRQEGKEIIVNVGGEGAKHEVRRWPHAINLNILTKARPTSIQNLVRGRGEDIAKFFEAGSVDKIVASKIPTSVDPARLAKGGIAVLRSGGTMEINIFGSAVDDWGKVFIESLVKQGVRPNNIRKVGDVLFLVTK